MTRLLLELPLSVGAARREKYDALLRPDNTPPYAGHLHSWPQPRFTTPDNFRVRLEPLYTLRFRYPEEGRAAMIGGEDEENFFFAEGRAEGKIAGRFRGANHPRRRGDRTFRMNMQGYIETDDGGQVVIDFQGYGRTHPVGRRQVVGAAWHFSDHEPLKRLNDAICVIAGEVRRPSADTPQADVELMFEIAELIWEQPPD